MFFNSVTGAAERKTRALTGLMFVVWLFIVFGIGYIAIHFITKFW